MWRDMKNKIRKTNGGKAKSPNRDNSGDAAPGQVFKTISLTKDFYAEVETVALSGPDDKNFSRLVRKLLREYLARQKPQALPQAA